MLNLFSLKEKKVEEAREGGSKKRTSAAQLRITKVTNDQGRPSGLLKFTPGWVPTLNLLLQSDL